MSATATKSKCSRSKRHSGRARRGSRTNRTVAAATPQNMRLAVERFGSWVVVTHWCCPAGFRQPADPGNFPHLADDEPVRLPGSDEKAVLAVNGAYIYEHQLAGRREHRSKY